MSPWSSETVQWSRRTIPQKIEQYRENRILPHIFYRHFLRNPSKIVQGMEKYRNPIIWESLISAVFFIWTETTSDIAIRHVDWSYTFILPHFCIFSNFVFFSIFQDAFDFLFTQDCMYFRSCVLYTTTEIHEILSEKSQKHLKNREKIKITKNKKCGKIKVYDQSACIIPISDVVSVYMKKTTRN